jgi:HPt (histidine-containing phosphotransfer) domain-containing protein
MTAKLQKEDYAELVRDAHTVKGLAANISADALHHAARQLEEVARTGQKAAASASLELVRSEWVRLRECLDRLASRTASR